jgi:hypothetical protein
MRARMVRMALLLLECASMPCLRSGTVLGSRMSAFETAMVCKIGDFTLKRWKNAVSFH